MSARTHARKVAETEANLKLEENWRRANDWVGITHDRKALTPRRLARLERKLNR